MTKHRRRKSNSLSLISFNRAFRLTSWTVSGDLIASDASGTFMFSNKGFIRKATRYFLDSSWIGFSCSMSSAVIVSRISCSVCRSESPGNRGIPLKISAKMQPIAQTSTVPE